MREIQISGCTEGKGSISKALQIPLGSCLLVSQQQPEPVLPAASCQCLQAPNSPGTGKRWVRLKGLKLGVLPLFWGVLGYVECSKHNPSLHTPHAWLHSLWNELLSFLPGSAYSKSSQLWCPLP